MRDRGTSIGDWFQSVTGLSAIAQRLEKLERALANTQAEIVILITARLISLEKKVMSAQEDLALALEKFDTLDEKLVGVSAAIVAESAEVKAAIAELKLAIEQGATPIQLAPLLAKIDGAIGRVEEIGVAVGGIYTPDVAPEPEPAPVEPPVEPPVE